jgi:hypothetical protein
MIYYTNECASCGLPCNFERCPNYRVKHVRCDFCKDKNIKLYKYNGWEICEECLLREFEVVDGTDDWY